MDRELVAAEVGTPFAGCQNSPLPTRQSVLGSGQLAQSRIKKLEVMGLIPGGVIQTPWSSPTAIFA